MKFSTPLIFLFLLSLVFVSDAQIGAGAQIATSAVAGLFEMPISNIILGFGVGAMKLSIAGRMLGIISDWFVNRGPNGVTVNKEIVNVSDEEDDEEALQEEKEMNQAPSSTRFQKKSQRIVESPPQQYYYPPVFGHNHQPPPMMLPPPPQHQQPPQQQQQLNVPQVHHRQGMYAYPPPLLQPHQQQQMPRSQQNHQFQQSYYPPVYQPQQYGGLRQPYPHYRPYFYPPIQTNSQPYPNVPPAITIRPSNATKFNNNNDHSSKE